MGRDISKMSNSISVVTPTFNSAATLEQTLFSLRQQRNCDVTLHVVDSGSDDGTLEICKRWDVPVSYTPPGNMYRAINVGMRLCNTPWLAYLNSDDLFYPLSLQRLIKFGETTQADIVYGTCDYIDHEGRFLHSFSPAHPDKLISIFRCGGFGFAQQSAIFRTHVFNDLNGFDEKFSLNADADFYWRATERGFRFAYLQGSSVACFRLSRTQLSNKQAQVMRNQKQMLQDVHKASKSTKDKVNLYCWKIRNIPQYLIRVCRRYVLSGRITLPRSIEPYDFD